MNTIKVVWFEIPVANMDRAKAFYEAVFNTQILVHDLDGTIMGWFPGQDESAGAPGSLILHEQYKPSHDGTLVYLNSQELSLELSRVQAAGGKILQEKTMISPEHGFMGLFQDTEGNRIALHSTQ